LTKCSNWLEKQKRVPDRVRAKETHFSFKQSFFDGCFRVSEAVSLTPQSLMQTPHGWVARIKGKGKKVAEVAIAPSLAARLQFFAYRQGIKPDEKIFPVSTTRAWQIVDRTFEAAGIRKPEHVGAVHGFRHSGAIAKLAAAVNPKPVPDRLRHKEARRTLRYLKTLSAQESIRIQLGVDFQW
jgi:integrase